jgi:hypothetical protein
VLWACRGQRVGQPYGKTPKNPSGAGVMHPPLCANKALSHARGSAHSGVLPPHYYHVIKFITFVKT